MVKYLLIIFNSLLAFVYTIFGGDGTVTITGKISDKLIAGIESPVEILIKKGELNGFAKLQVSLPAGVTIKESSDMGATFSFDEGLAKWVWASLPVEEEMIIKFTVIAERDSEKKSITAKFLYVKENDKQEIDMEPLDFVVTTANGEISAAVASPIDSAVTGIKKDSAFLTAVPEISHFDPAGEIKAVRKITGGEGTEKIITIAIHKGLTKGFARYSDDLPQNVQAKEIQTDGSSFSVADGKIKFVWVNVPEKSDLLISYRMTVPDANPIILKGEYSYLENNQSKKIILIHDSLNLQPPALVKNETEEKKEIESVKPDEKKPAEDQVEEQKVKEVVMTPAKKEVQVIFMVQVGAFNKKKVTAKILEKKFALAENIKSDMQGGFSKFMVGDHNDYKDARDHRERLIEEKKIKTAVVVAYNHGKRITVQEALMITNQRWLK